MPRTQRDSPPRVVDLVATFGGANSERLPLDARTAAGARWLVQKAHDVAGLQPRYPFVGEKTTLTTEEIGESPGIFHRANNNKTTRSSASAGVGSIKTMSSQTSGVGTSVRANNEAPTDLEPEAREVRPRKIIQVRRRHLNAAMDLEPKAREARPRKTIQVRRPHLNAHMLTFKRRVSDPISANLLANDELPKADGASRVDDKGFGKSRWQDDSVCIQRRTEVRATTGSVDEMEAQISVWTDAAACEDSDQLAKLIAGLPKTPLRDCSVSPAASARIPKTHEASTKRPAELQGQMFEQRVLTLRYVSMNLSMGGDPRLGLTVAIAGLRFCMESFELLASGKGDTFRWGVAGFAFDAARTYERIQRFQEMRAVLETAIEWLESRDAPDEISADVRFKWIESLVELGELESASNALSDEAERGGKSHPQYNFLEMRLNGRLVDATEGLKLRGTHFERTGDDHEKATKLAIESMLQVLRRDPNNNGTEASRRDHASQTISRALDEAIHKERPQTVKDVIARFGSSFRMFSNLLQQTAAASDQKLLLQDALVRAGSVIADEKTGHDIEQLKRTLQTLEAVRNNANASGLTQTAEDSLWMLSIAYSRLGMPTQAIAVLQDIRSTVKTRRALIQNPMKRAGISKEYPLLYIRLCALLAETGDTFEMLDVVEEAKGRVLTDKLALEAGRDDNPQSNPVVDAAASEWLPNHMRSLGAHYLTYLVDDDVTYAVLVARDGTVHQFECPLGVKTLMRLRHDFDPSRWGKKIHMFSRRPADVAQQLSPLVERLGPLVEAGVIRHGDHICYAPDGPLHLVPLHYVDFLGEPLVRRFSLSRTHGATIMRTATSTPDCRPSRFVAFEVPLEDEEADSEKVEKLSRASASLKVHMQGKAVVGADGDWEAVASALNSAPTDGLLVHFATHGRFPDYKTRANPFTNSGLLLAADERLPVRLVKGEIKGGLLSPRHVINTPLNFANAHVTMQACVSGLSEEGIGGDALGLEWSLLMAGARSVLSTHWNVPAGSSADFSVQFYKEWLVNGASRAAAWRTTVMSLMSDVNPFHGENAYEWAMFSLAGDWR